MSCRFSLPAVGCLEIVALLALPVANAHAESTKLWSFKPETGFVDEPLAFSADGSRFAYLHTDTSTFLKIIVLRTDGFKKEHEITVDDPSRVPRQLAFSPDGSRLVLIWSDGGSGAHGVALYETPSGKLLKKLGPATAAVVTGCGGEQCLALTTRKAFTNGSASNAVAAYRIKDLKRIGAGGVTVEADQTMKSPALRMLYFDPGNISLMGMQKGKYDKKRDIRLPERAVRWSLIARKELWAQEPKDLLEWTKAINMRPAHPGQNRFLQVSEDLKELLLVDGENKIAKISVPVRWLLYEPKSLIQIESWDGKTLFFSLTIDTVNPEAVKRKKADKERVDIYRIQQGTAVKSLGQVETGKRGFLWAAGSHHFAFLRRLKGFGRGGTQIELYRVGP